MTEPHVFLTTAEVAQLLRVKEETIRRRIRRGKIPAIRIGKGFRVKASELDELLESKRIAGSWE